MTKDTVSDFFSIKVVLRYFVYRIWMEMDLAEIAGFCALMIAVCAYQIANPKTALYFLCTASVCWTAHFLLMGEIAYIVTFFAAIRSFCAAKLNVTTMKYVVLCCFLTSATFTMFHFVELKDLLPVLGIFLTCLGAFNRDNGAVFRLLYLNGESTWIVYGLLAASVPLTISCSFSAISIFISILRHDIKIHQNKYRFAFIKQ